MEFSAAKKTMKTTLKSPGWDYALYHDYEHHQTLVYNMLDAGRGSCKVYPNMGERLGFFLLPDSPVKGKSPTASEVLRLTGNSGFDNEKIKVKRTQNVRFRSLPATQYESCQKITISDMSEAIVKVTHLISNANLARTEYGTVPLQVTFEGKFVSGRSSGNSLKHVYNFFHYSTNVGPEDFQTPLGIVCKGRQGPTNFPQPPLHIRFGQEIHDSQTSRVITIRTTYDKEFNFVAEEFFDPNPGRQPKYRFDDFYAGLTYNIDRNTNFCDVRNISDAMKVNDFTPVKGGKIKMATPEQFWDREGVQYHYNGRKHFRGLETEAWIGQDPTTGYMYEWYFTLGIDHAVNDEAKSEQKSHHRIPYKRIFWPDKTNKFISTFYFQVDLTQSQTVCFYCRRTSLSVLSTSKWI
ncbi:EF-hand domain-containing protein D1 [Elysia marginata]|uniref:EF-hand domain-containing protein D1 n=1 Tax=Elysia marginata TaxID=1093978 RepID=A0AAV4ECR7_9GAST|nr:EF-hand domain-containing protein D1 [Elysia marginata]